MLVLTTGDKNMLDLAIPVTLRTHFGLWRDLGILMLSDLWFYFHIIDFLFIGYYLFATKDAYYNISYF